MMLAAGMKSRPVYEGLQIDPHARRHLFALQGDGALAVLDQSKTVGIEFLAKAEVLYVADGAATYEAELRQLNPLDIWIAHSTAALLNRLQGLLLEAKMGLRLYTSGTEGFIGQAIQVALGCGIDIGSIQTEHRGSAARRVQCVHCKGITENVTTSPFSCSHCALPLLVRDHYSRRLAAFQGVNIDAEDPGSAPPPRVLFP